MREDPSVIDRAEELLRSPSSRKHFLAGAAIAAATAGVAPKIALASAIRGEPLRKMPESTAHILNIAITAEAAAVTVLYNVHRAVNAGTFKTSGISLDAGTLVKVVRAILRQEQDHYSFLAGAGAKPAQTKFDAPAAVFKDARSALSFLETADEIFTAAYMTATREFAQGGHDKLAQYTYQIGGTEAEHRALARFGQGKVPNNRSFERNLFPRVSGAVSVLGELGVLKPVVSYPGAAAVDRILATSGDHDETAGIIQRTP
jgi:ferritin-like protein